MFLCGFQSVRTFLHANRRQYLIGCVNWGFQNNNKKFSGVQTRRSEAKNNKILLETKAESWKECLENIYNGDDLNKYIDD